MSKNDRPEIVPTRNGPALMAPWVTYPELKEFRGMSQLLRPPIDPRAVWHPPRPRDLPMYRWEVNRNPNNIAFRDARALSRRVA